MIKKLFVLLIFLCSTPAMVLQKTANNDLPFVYYVDKTNDFAIEQIKSLPTSSWKRVKNFKRFSSVVWLRLEIVNDCAYEKWILCSRKPPNYEDVYLVENGHIVYESHVGTKVAYEKRDIPHRYCLFPLHIEKNKRYTLYVRLQSVAVARFNIGLYEKDAFAKYDTQDVAYKMFFYGCLFLLVIYNAVIGFFTRNIKYLYYCLYFMGFNIYFLLEEGFIAAYNIHHWQNEVHIFAVLCKWWSFYLFVYYLLDVKTHFSYTKQLFRFFIVALPTASCLYFVGLFTFHGSIRCFMLSIVFLTCALPWMIWKIRYHNSYVIYFGLGWLTICCAAIANILLTEGIISNVIWNDNVYKVITVFEGVVFSLALVDRVNQEKEAKMRLQQELHSYQELEKSRLQTMVNEKTELLQKAIADVEKSSRAKSEFLALMSHELRTPLNAIMGFSYALGQQQDLCAKARKDIRIIYQSGEHLLNVINMVLDLSKIEAEHMDLKLQDVDFDEFLRELCNIFSFKARQKGIAFIFDSNNIPRFIHCDKTKLRQILLNILSNAVKFTEKGNVRFVVTAQQTTAHEVHLVFKVHDTGCGIDAQEIKKVFQPFVQTSSGEKQEGGIGLGMAISLRFAQLMAGKILIDSGLGKGTTVTLEIPVNVVQHISKDSEAKFAIQQHPQLSVLIADDKDVNRALLKKILDPFQFRIYEASTGKEAIALWERHRPYITLMDIRMPELDGREATKHIKNIHREAIIIAITASAFEEDKEAILAAGCDEILIKPVHPLQLLQVMEKYSQLNIQHQQDGDNREVTVDILSQRECHLLKKAVIEASMDKINAIINEIPQPLQGTLKKLADNFDYEEIIYLLDKHQE